MKIYIKSSAEYALNPDFNGIEIKFDGKPSQETLDDLKANGFRWHNKKKVWYAKQSPDRLELAQQYATEVEQLSYNDVDSNNTPSRQQTEPVNQYGVKVGDMFYASWGYDQTNINFFQVIGLRGKTSVLVREVQPDIKSDNNSRDFMSRRISAKVSGKILPPSSFSVFIKDQENGDLKRIQQYNGRPYFKLASYTNAYPYNGESLYESWGH